MARRKKQNEDESQENINNESDDTFGLPEIEYEPLKRDEPAEESVAEPVAEAEEVAPEIEESYQEEEVEEQTYRSPYAEPEEESSVWPKVLGVVIVILIAGAAAWYFLKYKPEQEAKEKTRLEQLATEAAKQEAERLAEIKRQNEQRIADSLAQANAKPAEGTIEALTERTGRYYIVVASAIDDDLIMDYANKLVKNGATCKIIPPFGKTKFSRLAVDSKDTYAEAQSTADGMKGGDYGNDIWVVKY